MPDREGVGVTEPEREEVGLAEPEREGLVDGVLDTVTLGEGVGDTERGLTLLAKNQQMGQFAQVCSTLY